jgi:hypothetical protein
MSAAREPTDRPAKHGLDVLLERIHLGGLIVMAVGATSSNAIEGIGFAVALVATLIRIPRLADDYSSLARQPVVWTFTALLLLIWIGRLWGDVGPKGFGREFERLVLLPWLLWPFRHHSRPLLAAVLGGAILSVAILTLRNWTSHGFSTGSVITHGKDLGMLGAGFAASFVLAIAMPDRLLRLGLWLRLFTVLALLWGMYILGQRTPQVVALAASLFIVSVTSFRPEWKRWTTAAIVVLMIATTVAVRPPPKLATSLSLASAAATQSLTDGDLARMTSHRYQLALAAERIWRDSPWIGAGTGTFRGELNRIATTDPESLRLPREQVALFSNLITAHNGFLDELACRGIVGLGLLVGCLALVGRAALRPPGSVVLATSLLAWILFSFANATTERGTFQVMLAAMVTCAATIQTDGLGRQSNGRGGRPDTASE